MKNEKKKKEEYKSTWLSIALFQFQINTIHTKTWYKLTGICPLKAQQEKWEGKVFFCNSLDFVTFISFRCVLTIPSQYFYQVLVEKCLIFPVSKIIFCVFKLSGSRAQFLIWKGCDEYCKGTSLLLLHSAVFTRNTPS